MAPSVNSGIVFSGIRHAYGERQVLDGIDLVLSEPRVGIIGANGSGKSSLARMINGLVTPTSGRVTVDGLDVVKQGAAVRRRVGFVFPNPDAQIVMPTVAEDVAFSLRRRKLPRDQVDHLVGEVLIRFGLDGHRDHPAHLLSSGQKQLLAIAAIMVTEPSVLVCDEPTTLLDLRHSRQVADLLEGLSQQVIMVTHQLDLLVDWARVVVVDGGRIVHDGPGRDSVAFYRELMSC
ncbi:biotin transport system ATP-binding protein [Austwickia chelonae]|uniref:Putative ABC transporter ATP-binding protein n=1 Tax=Austwickia chelonae NBRC 105200 TaxID=1184607 RepID=K6VRW8_9MICO|nr:putative ABC transporter ATP-binding protein [Austwickia chelonae NBRC 105200]SEV95936.1 biotin transport system ATP-binding protein [Austwickia chelonae]